MQLRQIPKADDIPEEDQPLAVDHIIDDEDLEAEMNESDDESDDDEDDALLAMAAQL